LSSRRKAAISLAVESVCARAKGVNAKPAATSAGNKQAALVIAPPLLSSGPFSGIFSAYARVERRLRQMKNPLLP
jgi:hypothetical protein